MRDKWIKSIEKRFAKTVGQSLGLANYKIGYFQQRRSYFSEEGLGGIMRVPQAAAGCLGHSIHH